MTATATLRRSLADTHKLLARNVIPASLVFLVSYLVLFGGMIRHPGTFDEGIILTGAMRVAARQIPHRDFYVLYGPAQFYVLSSLFKVFGRSILVERLYDLLTKALVVTTVYGIASAFCRRHIAASAALIALLWLFGLNQWPGSATIQVSLLSLISSALLLPVFHGLASSRRMVATGCAAGLAALFRYDTGVALFGVHVCAMTAALYLRRHEMVDKLRASASLFAPYTLGFALITVPPALYYLSVAPLRSLAHDMVGYPSKYYHRGRNLPFPPITIHSVENFGIYLPLVIAAIAIYVVGIHFLRTQDERPSRAQDDPRPASWYGYLVTFGLLTLAMYLKGYVRVTLFQLYLAIIPSVLLIAMLGEHRRIFPRAARLGLLCLAGLSFLAAASLAFHQAKELYLTHSSIAEYMLSPVQHSSPPAQSAWCEIASPVTSGLCFLPDQDRIRTIEFITTHTRPDQPIYVGLIEHQKIFASDNILYFATQRLPATKWSELDPDLESRYDIQTQMIHEFEANAPPYIVLDSEFEEINEPNDSSKRSGVTLLDDYIRSKYEQVESFGMMSIWRRRS
jgi:hypothetical protein